MDNIGILESLVKAYFYAHMGAKGAPPIDECVGWEEMATRRWNTMLVLLGECFSQVDLSDTLCAALRNGYRDVWWALEEAIDGPPLMRWNKLLDALDIVVVLEDLAKDQFGLDDGKLEELLQDAV